MTTSSKATAKSAAPTVVGTVIPTLDKDLAAAIQFDQETGERSKSLYQRISADVLDIRKGCKSVKQQEQAVIDIAATIEHRSQAWQAQPEMAALKESDLEAYNLKRKQALYNAFEQVKGTMRDAFKRTAKDGTVTIADFVGKAASGYQPRTRKVEQQTDTDKMAALFDKAVKQFGAEKCQKALAAAIKRAANS